METREHFSCAPDWTIERPDLLSVVDQQIVQFRFPTPQRIYRSTFAARAAGATRLSWSCVDSTALVFRRLAQARGDRPPPHTPGAVRATTTVSIRSEP